ncbi:MAG: flagellar biosynthesis protein FlhA [Gemmatimonadetes bacterium]|nr:flagellar biosynthesis protein FlhA [Gemmatimonadota bacterium]MBK7784024.1 flagellar biosynthesis protein FlhA [Gemmatimonadota bacterium]MBK7924954.1 flagellar biosynthesis protein FlhA [Gemmatimonadota bacterium]MBK9067929.1 flagellar biosynthesis protein FlhA [Gemmatimonadota bacterium]MBK9693048.1 flagellar biosynthesis protein FlhA [Gemmatimonadota bacterium]
MLARLSAGAEVWLALAVVVVVALLIVPLPPAILDALLATSLAISVLVLLVTLSVTDPLEFSIFPSLLLLVTLLRLGLNVNSTRLILSHGHAGEVIAAFGNAVIGGNYVVGLVIFLILIVINFMVITKGAGRVAEVAARFTLDAMPGRQMSIDADLGAGLIDETEARRRREEIQRYADFYGAMDGAAKFVRGDAIAGLIIVAINLVGGFIIGVTQQGMSATEALGTFTSLTVGDGLITQIPALIVSTAAGIIVTYGSHSPSVGPAIAAQLTRHQNALWMSSGIIGGLGLVPGFPFLPFFVLGSALGGIAWLVRGRDARAREPEAVVVSRGQAPKSEPAPIKDLLQVEPLEVEVGYALVPLVDEAQKGDLLQRIGLMRKQLAMELGIMVPPARIRDNIQLPATEYAIKLRGVRVATGEILPRYQLALDTTGIAAPIEGIRTTDPSFGLPAVWITADRRTEAEANGYSVVEPQTVLATHLMETIKAHAAELLSRQSVRELLDGLKETHPALVDDTIPGKLSLGTVHRVLQRLLREGVPIRDLALILETLSDAAEVTKDPEALTEQVRRSLAPVLVQLFDDGDGAISGITIGPRLETALMGLFSPRPTREGQRPMEPEDLTTALRQLNDLMTEYRRDGQLRPLITPPALRVGIRRLVEPVMPNVPVLSLGELPAQTPIHSLATWELTRAA